MNKAKISVFINIINTVVVVVVACDLVPAFYLLQGPEKDLRVYIFTS